MTELTKKLWPYIKSRKQQNFGIPDLKDKNQIQTSLCKKKANLIWEHLDTVFFNHLPNIQANFDKNQNLLAIKPVRVMASGIQNLFFN